MVDPQVHNPAAPSRNAVGGGGEPTITPDRRTRVVATYRGFKKYTDPSAQPLTGLPGGCGLSYRSIDGGAVTLGFADGGSETHTHVAGEGYDVELAAITASGVVLVFY